MLNRYIGNKNAIIGSLIEEINKYSNKGDLICDAFSGSLAVSFALKVNGYNVACNDINLFSFFYGKHLIEQISLPAIQSETFLGIEKSSKYREKAIKWINELPADRLNYKFLNKRSNKDKYAEILAVYLYLSDLISDSKNSSQTHYFYNTYTEEGCNSSFLSARGTSGKRRFFTPSNGRKIDIIMSKIRDWKTDGLFDEGYFYYTLVCSVIDSIEKVSNTQGTYHDFPRDQYDSRAMMNLKLIPPDYDGIISELDKHIVGYKEDSLHFVERVPKHSILYLDPPYNFRQYTSYYFFPNIICEYSDIDDLESYFNNVQYVRGQNMSNDFTSTFSKKNEFMESLKMLIRKSKCEKIMLSYFDGRNHWNNTTKANDHKGKEILWEFFTSNIFKAGQSVMEPFERLNYQSYGGHKAKNINEFLFIGEKD